MFAYSLSPRAVARENGRKHHEPHFFATPEGLPVKTTPNCGAG
jgi:hypothetical protein